MKFTLSWLKQFLDTSATISEIAAALTDIGLEVEEIIDKRQELQNFETAYIVNTKPHPTADKLQICQVQTKDNIVQIICGASNARAGIKVVLAPVGVLIPNGKFKIKESVIRGEKSSGMLCSEEELFLASKSDGIIELPGEAEIGKSFIKYYGLDDPVFDINVTPNRGDALSVYGIARDLAAKNIGKLKILETSDVESKFVAKTHITVTDRDACPLFAIREIKNLKNKPSPDWLQKLLKNINIKPISAVVDITNYISYSFGQPMHAYDADKLVGDIVVTDYDNEVQFHALNDKKYTLRKYDLIIKDSKEIQALAGIIGGFNSSCDDNTANILLEAACFNAKKIAATGRRLQVDTDSRYRFERNIDRNFTEKALNIATNLILSICGGEASEIVIKGEQEVSKKSLDFPIDYFEKVTGFNLNINVIESILNKLGFILRIENGVIKIAVPSWRHDINIAEDIVEEIIRIYGYDKLAVIKLPEIEQGSSYLRDQKKITTLKRIIAGQGYDEVVTNSFINDKIAMLFGSLKEELFLRNPISCDNNYMRSSILPNLLSCVQKNVARSIKDVALFEFGPIFTGSQPSSETISLAGIKYGLSATKNIYSEQRSYDVFDIKTDLEKIFDYVGLAINKCNLNNTAPSYYHPTRSASIFLGKNLLGYFGQIHPKIITYFDISEAVFAFEINTTDLPPAKIKYGKREEFIISDFQVNYRDFAFIIDQDKPVGEIISYINNFDKKLVKSAELFDIYAGDKLPDKKKSIAIKVKLQANDCTLTETDLHSFSTNLINNIEKKFQGKLRE